MILKNKVAIITGGARGIGRVIAEAFCRQGAQVVIASRTARELKDAAKQLSLYGQAVYWLKADISKKQDIARLVKFVLSKFGRIDILVNNAAVLGPVGGVDKVDAGRWIRAVEIDLIGTFLLCRAVIPQMKKQKSGRIINLSGGGASAPRPNFSAYAASKAAVVRLTETLSEELRPYNIQVNAIAPGMLPTRMTKEVIEQGLRAGKKEYAQALRCRRKKTGSFRKVAELALFLASFRSGNLSGRLISAQWDDWESFPRRANQIKRTSLYTLRRIDGRNFKEAGHD